MLSKINLKADAQCLNVFCSCLLCLRAGRSAWYDRHVGIVEAAGNLA